MRLSSNKERTPREGHGGGAFLDLFRFRTPPLSRNKSAAFAGSERGATARTGTVSQSARPGVLPGHAEVGLGDICRGRQDCARHVERAHAVPNSGQDYSPTSIRRQRTTRADVG